MYNETDRDYLLFRKIMNVNESESTREYQKNALIIWQKQHPKKRFALTFSRDTKVTWYMKARYTQGKSITPTYDDIIHDLKPPKFSFEVLLHFTYR